MMLPVCKQSHTAGRRPAAGTSPLNSLASNPAGADPKKATNMKHKLSLAAIVALCAALAGCAGTNVDGMMGAGTSLFKAASLSDGDVKAMSDQSCAELDKANKIAAPGSTYNKRLTKIMAGLQSSGLPSVNAKVYLTKDVNAWAMANGCVRVYSGLMDMMTDDEVRGVVGHELGHVALGHTKNKMQVAYTAMAARGALAAAGGTVAALSASQLGEMGEQLINAQFSQTQESAADDYSFDVLTKNKANTRGLVTAFQKLAKLDGGKSSMFSSHPGSDDRAKHIEDRINKGS